MKGVRQMFDWNHNGKQDAGDSFMEFMIFNAVMNEDRNQTDLERDWLDTLDDEDE